MKKRDPEYQSHVLKVEEKLVREEARAKGQEEVGQIHNVTVHRAQGISYNKKYILEGTKHLNQYLGVGL